MALEKTDVEVKLSEIIEELDGGYDISSIESGTLIKDIKLDSLDVVTLLFEIEDFFNIKLEDSDDLNERMNLGTIGDLSTRILEEIELQTENIGTPV
ncbi:MAG: hypothetical protein HRU23_02180 [Gammaproteobacteria bacterium]|nr:hypothetical protein [Gammaproteobacteria bacterium]